jgi:hypothetical protein
VDIEFSARSAFGMCVAFVIVLVGSVGNTHGRSARGLS